METETGETDGSDWASGDGITVAVEEGRGGEKEKGDYYITAIIISPLLKWLLQCHDKWCYNRLTPIYTSAYFEVHVGCTLAHVHVQSLLAPLICPCNVLKWNVNSNRHVHSQCTQHHRTHQLE